MRMLLLTPNSVPSGPWIARPPTVKRIWVRAVARAFHGKTISGRRAKTLPCSSLRSEEVAALAVRDARNRGHWRATPAVSVRELVCS